MSESFVLLLVTAAFVAYGTVAAARSGAGWPARAFAILVYAALGVHTVLLIWWFGDGRVVPGFQLNPEIRNYYGSQVAAGAWPAPQPALGCLALLAHVLVAVTRPDRRWTFSLLPITLFFAWSFLHFRERQHDPATLYERAVGPERNAYLTIAPDGDGVRLIFTAASDDATLGRVLLVHDAKAPPPEPHLYWTKDGHAIVFATRKRRIFALDGDGKAVGALPVESHEWPSADPSVESVAVRRKFSEAARDVAKLVGRHGGLHVE